jgi:hypothetical protein
MLNVSSTNNQTSITVKNHSPNPSALRNYRLDFAAGQPSINTTVRNIRKVKSIAVINSGRFYKPPTFGQ